MANVTGTAGNNYWTLSGYYTGTLDGLAGVDTLSLGTLNGDQFTLSQSADGSVLIDTVAGASGQAPSHITLKNMEVLAYNSGASQIDLTTYFPSVTGFSPADGGTNVAVDSDIVLTFNTAVQRGNGNIAIHDGSVAGPVVEAFSAAASSLLSFTGNSVTIRHTNLNINTHYFVTVDAGAVQSTSGRAYTGTTAYDFTTSIQAIGTAGNDICNVGTANESVDGASGVDTVVYSGHRSAFTVTNNGAGLTVTDSTGALGTNVLTNVERVKFADTSLAFDINGNAGNVAKLLGAVFGADMVANKDYVGIGLSYLDNGMSYSQLMELALAAAGATSNDAVVTTLWTNIVGTAPTAADKAPFIDMLNNGTSAGALGIMAADGALNTNRIHLTGLIQTGIEYIAV